jgi:enoyl-CoA hydratase/carnithine racemase
MKKHELTLWEKHGSIGILTIHNPPDNSIGEPVFMNKNIPETLKADKEIKGIIIRGAGRHFSSGADINKLKHLAKNPAALSAQMSAGKQLASLLESIDIPVVASISGVCFGAGLEIALACHIRICSDNSLFAFPETNYGIMPGLGGTVMLSKLIGQGKSAEIILSGNIISAQKALNLGMADYVTSSKELHQFSVKFLQKLTADRDIDVINCVMKSIHNAQTIPYEKALEEETRMFCALAAKSLQYPNKPE